MRRKSAIRSGNSLNKSPVGLCIPFSTASMPSNMLHNNRSGIHTTTSANHPIRAPGPAPALNTRPTAPTSANSAEITEIWLGVSRKRHKTSALLAAHDELRCGMFLRCSPSGSDEDVDSVLIGLNSPRVYLPLKHFAAKTIAKLHPCEAALPIRSENDKTLSTA